jgi:hypothetical protein
MPSSRSFRAFMTGFGQLIFGASAAFLMAAGGIGILVHPNEYSSTHLGLNTTDIGNESVLNSNDDLSSHNSMQVHWLKPIFGVGIRVFLHALSNIYLIAPARVEDKILEDPVGTVLPFDFQHDRLGEACYQARILAIILFFILYISEISKSMLSSRSALANEAILWTSGILGLEILQDNLPYWFVSAELGRAIEGEHAPLVIVGAASLLRKTVPVHQGVGAILSAAMVGSGALLLSSTADLGFLESERTLQLLALLPQTFRSITFVALLDAKWVAACRPAVDQHIIIYCRII